MLFLLVIVGCSSSKKNSDTDDGSTTVEVVLSLGSEGGTVEIEGNDLLLNFRLVLPPDVLSQDETGTLSLIRHDSKAEDHPDYDGAEYQFGIEVIIEPEDLYSKVEGALIVEVELDPASPSLTEEQQQLIAEDSLGWAGSYLMLSRQQDTSGVRESDVCEDPVESIEERYKFGIYTSNFKEAHGLVDAVVLVAPWDVLNALSISATGGNQKPADNRWNIWRVAKPTQTISHSHPHFGDVSIEYFPLSVRSMLVDHSWPTNADDEAKVRSCLPKLFDLVADKLASHFKSMKVSYDGDELPYRIYIYDYDVDPLVYGTTMDSKRLMLFPSKWIDPSHYPSATNCIAEDNARAFQTLAHEMFHLQQSTYFYDQNDPPIFAFGREIVNETEHLSEFGPYTTVSAFKYQKYEWLYEATANYWAFEMLRGIGPNEDWSEETYSRMAPWVKHGLTSFALTKPAWYNDDGTIIASSHWSYHQSHFFKYLFDREKVDCQLPGGKCDLDLMASMWEKIEENIRTEYDSGAFDDVITESVKGWMEGQGLDWFGYFREYMLLRGCGDTCPLVPADRKNPYGTVVSPHSDIVGQAFESDWWSTLAIMDNLFAYNETPFASDGDATDEGRTLLKERCHFDSNADSYIKIETADAVSQIQDGLQLTFPPHVQYPLAGLRLDIYDDLDYQEDNRFYWKLEPSDDCSAHMKYEL
jgi:hypothetical protein